MIEFFSPSVYILLAYFYFHQERPESFDQFLAGKGLKMPDESCHSGHECLLHVGEMLHGVGKLQQ
ncbi:MAG: hypothetical protein ACP5F6_08275 [Microbacter sp.]